MWPFTSDKTRQVKTARRARSSFRPRLEALEDRCVPSAGALDLTFGAGYVTTSLSGGRDTAYSVLVQPDGKILATGLANQTTGKTAQVDLIRYNADGSLDASFGTGGEVLGPAGLPSNYYPMAALYPTTGTPNDGKIVLAEFSTNFSVARYNPNGTLDSSFGTSGIATANFGSTLGTAGSEFADIQPDGKVVVAGVSSNDKTLELARFNVDGSLDATFGQGGLVETALQGGDSQPVNETLLLQPNGGLIVTFQAEGGGFGLAADHWDMVAYNADGSLNTSFGNGGFVRTPPNPVSGDASPSGGSALYPTVGNANDGKIVMVGQGDNNGYVEWMVRRYNANGALDSTFGAGGTVYTKLPKNYGEAVGVAIQPDGKLVVSGYLVSAPNGEVVIRYNTDGSLDTTFGTKGIVTTAIYSGSRGYIPVLQPNGDIVVAGESDPTGSKEDFTVTRYLGDPTTLAVTGLPRSDTAGIAGAFTVTAYNASGGVKTDYTGTVHFTSSDPQAVLPADYTFTAADHGTHTFSATLETAGIQFLTAADAAKGFFGAEAGITVSPAAASTLSPSGFPSIANAGVAGSFTLTARDAFGNLASGYNGTVQFSSSDGGAALPAPTPSRLPMPAYTPSAPP